MNYWKVPYITGPDVAEHIAGKGYTTAESLCARAVILLATIPMQLYYTFKYKRVGL